MSPDGLSSRSTPVCTNCSAAVQASTGWTGWKVRAVMFSLKRRIATATTVSALLNQTLRGPICWPISAANSESGRSISGRSTRWRPSGDAWPSIQTRISRQWRSTMPGF